MGPAPRGGASAEQCGRAEQLSLDAGNLVVDLSQVTDPQALDGRTVHVSGGVGHLDITVPDDVTVVTRASISGPGGINAFGQDSGGIDTTVDTVHRAGPDAPTLTIDADLHIGAIDLATSPPSPESPSAVSQYCPGPQSFAEWQFLPGFTH